MPAAFESHGMDLRWQGWVASVYGVISFFVAPVRVSWLFDEESPRLAGWRPPARPPRTLRICLLLIKRMQEESRGRKSDSSTSQEGCTCTMNTNIFPQYGIYLYINLYQVYICIYIYVCMYIQHDEVM